MKDVDFSEKIIEELAIGPMKSSVLVKQIADQYNCTVQTVYAVLRKLKEAGVVISHKSILSLSTVWIDQQSKLLADARLAYTQTTDPDTFSFGQLEVGDRISYRFKNPILLDEMWGHLFNVLLHRVETKMPIMIYNAHSWFPIIRYETEKTIFSSMRENGYTAYFSLRGSTDLDRDIAKTFINAIGHPYSLGVDIGLDESKYINVIGDYLIEVEMDSSVSEQIESYYKKYRTIITADKAELEEIVAQRGINKLVVSKNPRKAAKIRKKLAIDFHIPASQRVYI